MCKSSKATGRKLHIPGAIREACWIAYNGKKFECKCHVKWCNNVITPFSYQVGHNVPESKGGDLEISNLRPICTKCNLSMGNRYTIDEFSAISNVPIKHNDVPIKHNVFTRLFVCGS